MASFNVSNINNSRDMNLIGLKIEGLLLRFRFVIYQVLLVSLNQSPLTCSLIISVLEGSYLLTYLYYSIRYRYAKSWLLLFSKFNVGLAIFGLSILSVFISIKNLDSGNSDTYEVDKHLQYIGMGYIVVSFILEFLIVFIYMGL